MGNCRAPPRHGSIKQQVFPWLHRLIGNGPDFHNRQQPGEPTATQTASPARPDMLNKITQPIDFQAKALSLRAERQRTIASNIANADTPGYVARDFKFADAMSDLTLKMSPSGDAAASAGSAAAAAGMSQPGHIPLTVLSTTSLQQGYAVASQPAMDNNTVDLDRERANFVDNSVRYEATLRFINGYTKTILSAIQGQ